MGRPWNIYGQEKKKQMRKNLNIKNLLRKFRKKIPVKYFGSTVSEFILSFVHPSEYLDLWTVKPFNGQLRRLNCFFKITDLLEPTIGIETGTFLGTTTPIIAAQVEGKTFTIESNKESYRIAKERFASRFSNLNIEAIYGDSVAEIKKILSNTNSNERVIAYLDAHWYKKIPTKQELYALIDWGGAWVALIDDFKIENDQGYYYDSYDETDIDLSVIPSELWKNTFFPKELSSSETGRKKGTAYIFSDKAIESIKISSLNDVIRIY